MRCKGDQSGLQPIYGLRNESSHKEAIGGKSSKVVAQLNVYLMVDGLVVEKITVMSTLDYDNEHNLN
jgi:hypothetical protein